MTVPTAAADAGVPTSPAVAGIQAGRRRDVRGAAFRAALLVALAVSLVVLAVLIYQMIVDGSDVLTGRYWQFLTTGTASDPAVAGLWQGIKGTFLLCAVVAIVAFPLGIGAAIYLEEYARDGRLTRIVNINIRNLAGVPSIVYGLLGLALFVQLLGDDGGGGLTGGRTVISGGLTLAVLVLPIVIITTQEALRAVPAGIREGALALGATNWEATRYHVVPAAAPGILTGTVLAVARAAGEAAPLLIVGAVSGVFFVGSQGLVEQVFRGGFTAVPMLIFNWARQPAGQGWPALTAAASLTLIALIVAMNAIAIYLRNRFERKW